MNNIISTTFHLRFINGKCVDTFSDGALKRLSSINEKLFNILTINIDESNREKISSFLQLNTIYIDFKKEKENKKDNLTKIYDKYQTIYKGCFDEDTKKYLKTQKDIFKDYCLSGELALFSRLVRFFKNINMQLDFVDEKINSNEQNYYIIEVFNNHRSIDK